VTLSIDDAARIRPRRVSSLRLTVTPWLADQLSITRIDYPSSTGDPSCADERSIGGVQPVIRELRDKPATANCRSKGET